MKPWGPEEDEVVFDGPIADVADSLGRTYGSVKARRTVIRKQHGLTRSLGFDWAACGTPAQYRKHLRWGIPTCESCRRAEYRRQQDCRKKLAQPSGNPRHPMVN